MDKEKIIKIFASNLRAERARKNYTQEKLAELAGITTEYISKIESEKYNPTLVVIVKIAKALDVTFDDLIPLDKI